MTAIVSYLDRYRLETTFDDGCVVHTYGCDPAKKNDGEEMEIEVREKWIPKHQIGAGGFGDVWLQETKCGKLRAVKQLPRVARNANYSRELATLAEVKDNRSLFVQFIGWYESKDFIFVAMEFVELGDLSRYLGDLSMPLHVKEITRQVLEGLAILHDRQICHRDIKPQNILVASLDPIRVKIADFGVSKLEKGTLLHTTIGTKAYCAPEILKLLPRKLKSRNSYTNAVDMWAVGCLVHEILTTKTPFLEEDLYSTMCSDVDISAPETDLAMISSFCNGLIEFPTAALEDCNIDEQGIDFVKKLMVANPRLRISAKHALRSAWLIEPELNSIFQSSRDHLMRFVSKEKPGLMNFFTGDLNETLLPYSYRAETLAMKLLEMGCPEDVACSLGVITLYDIVLLIDDGEKMYEEPKRKILAEFIRCIIEISSLGGGAIRSIRFANSISEFVYIEEGHMERVMMGLLGCGSRCIGYELRREIIWPFVTGRTGYPVTMERPILAITIAAKVFEDSVVDLKSVLKATINAVETSHSGGSDFVAFQFISIGDDEKTLDLFQSVVKDPEIGSHADHQSASDLVGDDTNTKHNWAAISKLFLGPLLKAWR